MKDCVIGSSGFIGSYLMNELSIEIGFNSKNIAKISDFMFDTVYCAAPSGIKWIANKFPEKDKESTFRFLDDIKNIRCKRFVFISTIDVYESPRGQDETFVPNTKSIYGLNRLMIEKHIRKKFSNNIVVRCPVIFGPGFKKNIIFDLLNENELHKIDFSRTIQFYDVRDLIHDINLLFENEVCLVNLAPEPLKISDLANLILKKDFSPYTNPDFMQYYMKTIHYKLFSSRRAANEQSSFIRDSSVMIAKINNFVKNYVRQ